MHQDQHHACTPVAIQSAGRPGGQEARAARMNTLCKRPSPLPCVAVTAGPDTLSGDLLDPPASLLIQSKAEQLLMLLHVAGIPGPHNHACHLQSKGHLFHRCNTHVPSNGTTLLLGLGEYWHACTAREALPTRTRSVHYDVHLVSTEVQVQVIAALMSYMK
jgi:hypothetical protein